MSELCFGKPCGTAEQSLRKIRRSLRILYHLLEFAYRICNLGRELGASVVIILKILLDWIRDTKVPWGLLYFLGDILLNLS